MDPYFDSQEDVETMISIPYSNCWSESEFSKYCLTSESLQYACQQASEGGKIFTEKFGFKMAAASARNHSEEEHMNVKSISTQTESESIEESGLENSTIGSIQSTMKCGSRLGSSRKISFLLLLFLVLITPCGQPVSAQSFMIDSESYGVTLATSMTRNDMVTSTLTTSIAHAVQSMMCIPMDTPMTMKTALIPHPLYNSRPRVKDLLPLSSTKTSLMLHPKYGTQERITALIPVYVKDTALIVHPHFSTSACKELTVLPARPILSCKTESSVGDYPSDHIDSLLLVTIFDRHIKNQDYHHCSLSDFPGSRCNTHDEDQQVASVCPLQTSREDGKIYSKIENEVPTQVYTVDIPGPKRSRSGGNDIFIAAVVVLSIFLLVCRFVGSNSDNSSVPTNQGEYSALPQRMDNEIGPLSTSHNHHDTVTVIMANQQCSTSDLNAKQLIAACSPLQEKDSVAENVDSGFGSLTPLQPQSYQSVSNSIGNYDSGLGSLTSSLHQSHQPTAKSNEQILSADTPNHIQSIYYHPESEESDDEDDIDIRDEIAYEAGLSCLSSDQPMTLCDADLLKNLNQECDNPSPSVSLNCEQFNPGISEEGAQEPSLLYPSMQNTATYDIHPVDIMNEPNCSIADDINHSAVMFAPIIFDYNDPLCPRHEIQINMKLEGNEKMHGAAVTVESSYLQDLCSFASPPKPPDININRPFLHQYGTNECTSVNILQDYPNPIQEAAARNSDPVDGALPHIPADEDPDQNISESSNIEEVPYEAPEFRPFENTSGDAPSDSDDGDHDWVYSSSQEERPTERSLLSLSMQNSSIQVDLPSNVLRGESDSSDSADGDQQQHSGSTESDQLTNVLPSPMQKAAARNQDHVDGALYHISAEVTESPDQNNGNIEDIPAETADSIENVSWTSDIDAPSNSEDSDHDQFNSSLQEEGPKDPSLLSLSMQNTAVQPDLPINVLRGEPNSNNSANGDQEQHSGLTENDQPTNALPIPMPINYDDPPYPHEENEIQVELEATKDMQGAAVTVECSHFKDLTSLAPPPKPPDVNANYLFMHHHGSSATRSPITPFQEDYPFPEQETDHPLPATSLLVGGISFALPPVLISGQSRVILPNLHPRNYIINSVVI